MRAIESAIDGGHDPRPPPICGAFRDLIVLQSVSPAYCGASRGGVNAPERAGSDARGSRPDRAGDLTRMPGDCRPRLGECVRPPRLLEVVLRCSPGGRGAIGTVAAGRRSRRLDMSSRRRKQHHQNKLALPSRKHQPASRDRLFDEPTVRVSVGAHKVRLRGRTTEVFGGCPSVGTGATHESAPLARRLSRRFGTPCRRAAKALGSWRVHHPESGDRQGANPAARKFPLSATKRGGTCFRRRPWRPVAASRLKEVALSSARALPPGRSDELAVMMLSCGCSFEGHPQNRHVEPGGRQGVSAFYADSTVCHRCAASSRSDGGFSLVQHFQPCWILGITSRARQPSAGKRNGR